MARISRAEKIKALFQVEGKCTPPADFYLHYVVNHDHLVRVKALTNQGSIEIREHEKNLDALRGCVAHWIVAMKISKRKYKHPLGTEAEQFKPLAKFYAVAWDIMSDFMDFKLAFGLQEYECTSHWFAYILYEFGFCASNEIGKIEILKDLQKKNRIMTDIKNGRKKIDRESRKKFDFISLLIPREYCPHTYELFEMLLIPHKNSYVDELREECLEKFVKASKSFATNFDEQIKSEAILNVGKDEDFKIMGRGRNRKTIKPELIDLETVTKQAFHAQIRSLFHILKSMGF